MKVIKEKNMTPMDYIIASNNSVTYKEVSEAEITMVKAGIYENTKGDTLVAIGTDDGTIYNGISATILDAVDLLIDLAPEKFDSGIKAKITTRKGRRGDFKMLEIL